MDINQIVYFIEVCNSGSITKAAESLHISQQGLSASIRRMESELGCDLFYRKQGGIVLTETGKAVLSEAISISKHVDCIKEYCSNRQDGKYRIKIALTESLIVRLPADLQRFLISGNDEFDIALVEKYSTDCCNHVEEGDCAMGLVYGFPDERKFNVVPLDNIKQVIIVNRKHPLASRDSITVSDLDALPFVITRRGTYPYSALSTMFSKAGVKLNVAYECDRPRQTIDIVSNNPLLVARTIADEVSEQDKKRVKAFELEDPLPMPVNLIWRRGHELNIFERIFKRVVLDCYK